MTTVPERHTLQVFEGLRIMVARNVNKPRGLVNSFVGASWWPSALWWTPTAASASCHLQWVEVRGTHVVGYPITVAYACAIATMQGGTLAHVSICPRTPGLVHWLSMFTTTFFQAEGAWHGGKRPSANCSGSPLYSKCLSRPRCSQCDMATSKAPSRRCDTAAMC